MALDQALGPSSRTKLSDQANAGFTRDSDALTTRQAAALLRSAWRSGRDFANVSICKALPACGPAVRNRPLDLAALKAAILDSGKLPFAATGAER